MSHPKDSEGNVFMIGDIIVYSRNQQTIGKGIVSKMYNTRGGWRGETTVRLGVKLIEDGSMVTLYKPERALIISRAPV